MRKIPDKSIAGLCHQPCKQIVGAMFENLGLTSNDPIYAIATMRAKEHVHGDEAHQSPQVTCKGSDFGVFWINPGTCTPARDKQYTQKFHLKFKTTEEKASLPHVEFD